MNIKKKKHKSLRFWVISLLAISAGAFSTSLVLSSCTTTSDDGTKIKVPSMSNTSQEVEVGKDASLFVNASCTGKVLNYQWYKATDENATEWQKIEGANSNTYKIPQTDITGGANSTLKYKVEVTSADNSVPKYTSPVFAVKVNNTSSTNTVTFTTNLPTTKTITAGDATTFNVVAKTNISNATLTYDWYLDKGVGSFQKVGTSTDGSYTIPSTDTSGVTSTQNWKLYVEAYPNGNENTKSTSLTCAITVNPKNSSGTDTSTISFTTNLSTADSMTAGNDKTFTVLAETKNVTNPSITYEWQADKTGTGTYTSLQTSTSPSYTIPASDTQSISSTTTWKLQVKAYVASDSSISAISNTCTLTINPQSGGTTPSPSPTPPTPSPSPSDPDNPSIVPPPAHTPSQGIGGRLSNDSSGINTVKYDQEKYIGDNSLSIAVIAEPNVNGIKTAITNYVNSHPSNHDTSKVNLNRVLNHFQSDALVKYDQFGTGWMLDYSPATTGNITDYYIATNMHVLSSYFTVKYTSSVDVTNTVQKRVEATLRIPFTKDTVSSLDVYISQPQYNTTDYKQNTNTYAYKWDEQWFKTDININNYESKLFPIGAYSEANKTGSKDELMVGDTYDMELQLVEKDTSGNVGDWRDAYYFGKNPSGGFLTQEAQNGIVTREATVEDFSVLKLSMNADTAFESKISSATTYKTMFEKMKAMFNVSNNVAAATEQSSYLEKLRRLMQLTANDADYSKNKADIDKLFMFYDKSLITGDTNTQLSIGGYPLKYDEVNGKTNHYVTYNTNTMTTLGGNIINYPTDTKDSRNKLGINQYTYKSGLYKVRFKSSNDYLMKNGMLQQGSSGGMIINKDYKIACINWGSFNYMHPEGEYKFLVESGIVTSVFSKTNKSSLIWEYVSYISSRDPNSQLSKLFANLTKSGYFTS